MIISTDQQIDPMLQLLNSQGPFIFRYPMVSLVFAFVAVVALSISIIKYLEIKSKFKGEKKPVLRYYKGGIVFTFFCLVAISFVVFWIGMSPEVIWIPLDVESAYSLAPSGIELVLDTARFFSLVAWANLFISIGLCITMWTHERVYSRIKDFNVSS